MVRLFFFTIALLIAAVAVARQEDRDALDLDQDGCISLKESVPDIALLTVFGQYDENRDAKLCGKELDKLEQARQQIKQDTIAEGQENSEKLELADVKKR